MNCIPLADEAFYSPQEIAGWSSLVARQAHNLKVVGSNPTPATTFPRLHPFSGCCECKSGFRSGYCRPLRVKLAFRSYKIFKVSLHRSDRLDLPSRQFTLWHMARINSKAED